MGEGIRFAVKEASKTWNFPGTISLDVASYPTRRLKPPNTASPTSARLSGIIIRVVSRKSIRDLRMPEDGL